MVVSSNELRFALNWAAVCPVSKQHGFFPIVCVAEVNPSKCGSYSKKDMYKLVNSSENQTGNLPVLLPLIPGMPIRITQNVAVDLGIANGTNGTLLGVRFPPSTVFSMSTCFETNFLVASNLC